MFYQQGPLTDEEIKSLLEDYQEYGKHYWETEIITGNPRSDRLVNDLTSRMGGLMDRLVLTIEKLYQSSQSVQSGENQNAKQ